MHPKWTRLRIQQQQPLLETLTIASLSNGLSRVSRCMTLNTQLNFARVLGHLVHFFLS